jgi:hypothetical protein
VNIAQTIPLADGFGMHNGSGGWWIVGAAVMMLFMGGMMWKAILGFVALGAVVGLGPIVKRTAQKMHEHCQQMMTQFAGHPEASDHAVCAGADQTEELQGSVERNCSPTAMRHATKAAA